MKHIIVLIAALCGVALSFAESANACTRHAGVRNFTFFGNINETQDLVFGNVTINGMDTVAACNMQVNGLEFFRNGLNPEIHASLPQDTRVCLAGARDKVRVVRSGTTQPCGAYTLRPLNYGTHKLIIVGMTGADLLSGGDGPDILDAFDGATDLTVDSVAGYRGNDEVWASSVGNTSGWGGSGNDKYFAFSGRGMFAGQDLSGVDTYSGSSSGTEHFCDQDGLFASAFCGNANADTVNFLFANDINCTFNPTCAAIGGPPNGPDR